MRKKAREELSVLREAEEEPRHILHFHFAWIAELRLSYVGKIANIQATNEKRADGSECGNLEAA